MRVLIVLPLLFALPALSQEASPDNTPPPLTSPQPEPRPDPEERLDDLLPDLPEEQPAETPGRWEELAETDTAFAMCVAELEGTGATFTIGEEAITAEDADCGIARPVTMSAVAPDVAIVPEVTLRCEAALALATWTGTHVAPAARLLEGRGRLSAIETGGSYTCRRRNNLPTGRLSEHSFGNGVDVMAFRFEEGEAIRVEPRLDEGSIEEAFQRAARATSCLHFTTVIGPGTDAAHADHIHLDIAARRGGFRLCQ